PPQSHRGTRQRRRAGKGRAESLLASVGQGGWPAPPALTPLDQSFPQSTGAPQPSFDAQHAAAILLVVVAEKMQQTVQREHAEFGEWRVPGRACLTPRQPASDDDVAQERLEGQDRLPASLALHRRKAENVRDRIFAP